MTKTKAAFLLSVRALFERRRRVYLWTFTFRDVVDDKIAFLAWNHLSTLLKREWQDSVGVPGIRVVEVHPGDGFVPGGHGLHFHLLVARRLPVQTVRRLAIRAGFGRIHVKKAKIGHAEYLAKYLSKADDGLRRGTRRWGMFGSFKGTRVRDIVVESELAFNCRRVRHQLKTWGRELFEAVNRLTVRFGHWTEWPTFPKLCPLPERQVSDNDYELPDGIGKDGLRVCFDVIRVLDSEINEYVTVLIPGLRTQQPF